MTALATGNVGRSKDPTLAVSGKHVERACGLIGYRKHGRARKRLERLCTNRSQALVDDSALRSKLTSYLAAGAPIIPPAGAST